MPTNAKAWLDLQLPLWGALMVAGGLLAQAVTVQAKVNEHDRALSDLRGVAIALAGLTAEVSGVREDVRDLKEAMKDGAR